MAFKRKSAPAKKKPCKAQLDPKEKKAAAKALDAKRRNDPNFMNITGEFKFFYSNESDLDSLDDDKLIERLKERYAGFASTVVKEQQLACSEMINDTRYLSKFMQFYHITIQDVIKLLNKSCPDIFAGMYMKKLKQEMLENGYL